MTDIKDRLHQMMRRSGFQSRDDQQTLLAGVQEIERLRAYVRTLNGQLAHIAGLSSNTVENVKRNLKKDGGWDLD